MIFVVDGFVNAESAETSIESEVAVSKPDTKTDPPALQQRERSTGVMGTDLKITVLGTDIHHLDAAIDAAIDELNRVESMMTDWRPSELMSLNSHAGLGPKEVPHELAVIIAHGVEMGGLTGGAFDITYAGAGKLWNFKEKPPRIPTEAAVNAALQNVGYQRLIVDVERDVVTLPKNMKIGLGGIAKGYGIDRAMKVIMNHNVKHAVVNAGGDMKVLGKNFGKPWEVAIKHPRDRDRAMASVTISNTSLVTSGDYERFFEKDGKRYHHIIDPRTGHPSNGCLSATVIAPETEFADALATALCVLTAEEGLKIVEKLDKVEAIVVGMNGNVIPSSGLVDAVR